MNWKYFAALLTIAIGLPLATGLIVNAQNGNAITVKAGVAVSYAIAPNGTPIHLRTKPFDEDKLARVDLYILGTEEDRSHATYSAGPQAYVVDGMAFPDVVMELPRGFRSQRCRKEIHDNEQMLRDMTDLGVTGPAWRMRVYCTRR